MRNRNTFHYWIAIAFLVMGRMATDVAAKENSFVKLTRGIVGGFVPAHVKREILIFAENGAYCIHVVKHENRSSKKQFQVGVLSKEDYDKLFKLIEKIGLWNLPREQPTGSQDIYQMDTAIVVRHGKKYWKNGGPGGCVHGVSKVQATKKQQRDFRELVNKIESLAESKSGNLEDSDSRKYRKASETVAKRIPKTKP